MKGNKNAVKLALHLYLDLLVFYQPISSLFDPSGVHSLDIVGENKVKIALSSIILDLDSLPTFAAHEWVC